MEIERKFIINTLPKQLETFPHATISQGYISTQPVIRIRQKNQNYYLTCKSKGLLAREEFEIEISKEEYEHLSSKVDYHIIEKVRYFIPYSTYTIELDIFKGALEGLCLAEVEFDSLNAANAFIPPDWFSKEVTHDKTYQNNSLCKCDKW